MTPETAATKLLELMGADNSCHFRPPVKRRLTLETALGVMMRAGFQPSDEDLELIAMGDQDEAAARFDNLPGYDEMQDALGIIFEEDATKEGL